MSTYPPLPLLFIGHGSPMNAIEDTVYTREWRRIGKTLPKPRAILMISAHWITQGETRISTAEHPEMIYDMHGFPDELYQVRYPAPGSSAIAREIRATLDSYDIREDPERGLDHGAWSVLLHLFPEHDIPVVVLSIDYSKPPAWQYELGQKLRQLREQGILIITTGNTVHNLSQLSFSSDSSTGYGWAHDFDIRVQKDIREKNHADIVDFQSWGSITRLAHPTHDHFLPLLVALGATYPDDTVEIFATGIDLGSIAMTSVKWETK